MGDAPAVLQGRRDGYINAGTVLRVMIAGQRQSRAEPEPAPGRPKGGRYRRSVKGADAIECGAGRAKAVGAP